MNALTDAEKVANIFAAISRCERCGTDVDLAWTFCAKCGYQLQDTLYVASRASIPERSAMWRQRRADGCPIISSWIDEAGEGETEDFGELWKRINTEIARSSKMVIYAEPGDFPLKGALIEVGIALGMGKPVVACLPGVLLDGRTQRPVGSWLAHPLVTRCDDLSEALAF